MLSVSGGAGRLAGVRSALAVPPTCWNRNNAGQQSRGMATLKDISIRLKSVKNIQKITASMKMVAAAKYAQAERSLKPARPYGEGAQGFYSNVEPTEEESAETEDAARPKQLLVLMTSDRGLCGGIHSNIVKEARAILAQKPADVDMKVICVGDKSRLALQRTHANNILMTGNEIGRLPPTFQDATVLAKAILDSGYEFDHGHIIYNRFRSVVAYNTLRLSLVPVKTLSHREKLSSYDSLDAEVLQSFSEYSLASLLFYALKECATSEQGSRMTAMDGATKNAGEMIDKLTLQFNRTRQSVITRELIEIISGAAAL